MEIGIISDTHGLVRPEVYDAFEGVDLIFHAGDIGSRDVIIELEALAPVKAVAGNVDLELAGRYPEQETFELADRIVHLQHVFRDLPPEAPAGEERIRTLVVFGHSHRPLCRQVGDTLYFNPGSAGPRRFKLPVTVGRLTLENDGARGRILSLVS
ncbi:MAG: metallophosphoesterase family protein [Nitrospinaceae bacterium]|nr:metallophosphoesterase family protein [Nitrospinaceae bacterium]NIU98156.1 YfcE family phosphodiesterase [Nitrospinaceae bacterium]